MMQNGKILVTIMALVVFAIVAMAPLCGDEAEVSPAATSTPTVTPTSTSETPPLPPTLTPTLTPTPTPTLTPTPTPLAAGSGYCDIVEAWYADATAGPVSPNSADIEFYFTDNNEMVQQMRIAAYAEHPEVTGVWDTYADAYQDLWDAMDNAGWTFPTPAISAEILTDLNLVLSDLEAHVMLHCNIAGFLSS